MSLKIYPVVLDLGRRLAPVLRVLRSRSSALADQMERALVSVPLNVAEGAYSRGKNRQARFQSAAASARETLACLETAEAMGFIGPMDPELGALFHRVIGTLVRPTLQAEQGVAWFFRYHRGCDFASSADGADDAKVRPVHRELCETRGDRYLAEFRAEEGVLFIGKPLSQYTYFTAKRASPRRATSSWLRFRLGQRGRSRGRLGAPLQAAGCGSASEIPASASPPLKCRRSIVAAISLALH